MTFFEKWKKPLFSIFGRNIFFLKIEKNIKNKKNYKMSQGNSEYDETTTDEDCDEPCCVVLDKQLEDRLVSFLETFDGDVGELVGFVKKIWDFPESACYSVSYYEVVGIISFIAKHRNVGENCMEFILQNYPDTEVCFSVITNPNFTENLLKRVYYFFYDRDLWVALTSSRKISCRFIMENSEFPWIWPHICDRSDFDYDFLKSHHELLVNFTMWDFGVISSRCPVDFIIEDLKSEKPLPWNWEHIARNGKITCEIVRKNIFSLDFVDLVKNGNFLKSLTVDFLKDYFDECENLIDGKMMMMYLPLHEIVEIYETDDIVYQKTKDWNFSYACVRKDLYWEFVWTHKNLPWNWDLITERYGVYDYISLTCDDYEENEESFPWNWDILLEGCDDISREEQEKISELFYKMKNIENEKFLKPLRVKSREGDVCCICLTIYGEDGEEGCGEIISLPCSHVFCERCIGNWFKIKKECGMCKAKIEI